MLSPIESTCSATVEDKSVQLHLLSKLNLEEGYTKWKGGLFLHHDCNYNFPLDVNSMPLTRTELL